MSDVGDNGAVIQGLNAKWTFFGANIMEWACGMGVFFIISLFGRSPTAVMVPMLVGMFVTAISLSRLRKKFPDEERGVRNVILNSLDLPPPGIPAPARQQPIWSQFPVRELPNQCRYVRLGLHKMFEPGVANRETQDSV